MSGRWFSFKKTQRIDHLTDIEGNWRYFQAWCADSDLITLTPQGLLFNNANKEEHLVYGGDVCDKGPGDIRLAQTLLDFKDANPTRVTLLAGNRDIKCLRFIDELTAHVKQRLVHGGAVAWKPASPPRDYVIREMKKEGLSSFSVVDIENFLANKSNLTCQAWYLKWMLQETMGCALPHHPYTTFEYRRLELANINQVLPNQITDEHVVESFIASVAPNGVMARYLQQCELGKIIGDTLFIHGAVTLENMGIVPGLSTPIPCARTWIDTLNAWFAKEVNTAICTSHTDTLLPPGIKPLDTYIINNPQSIVTTNWYAKGQLAPVPDAVVAYLKAAGIYRVVSGHQPFSDFPLILRQPDLEVIVGDTSYSDLKAEDDVRGQALHHLSIYQKKQGSYAVIDAIRKGGLTTNLRLPTKTQAASEEKCLSIGHFTTEGRLVRLRKDNTLVATELNGYVVVDYPLPMGQGVNEVIDAKRRHFLLASTSLMGGLGMVFATTPFIRSWLPSAKALAAGAPIQVNVSKMEPGQQVTVAWRGKPVWIIRRTKAMLVQLDADALQLRDPASLVPQQPDFAKNTYRSLKPEYLVLIGICTHLGCSPKYVPDVNALGPHWPGGFYCPCHGSTFDMAGRVFKGVPAPINLEVPPYHFINEQVIEIG